MAELVKATRNRNPAFPALNLERAMELAERIYERESRKPMAPETAAKHWGYSIKSSGAQQSMSALKQFGLLMEEGDGNARKLRLSELALKIIIGKRTSAAGFVQALQEAALSPKLYAELWEKADEHGLPSDIELEHYLLLERKPPFYEDAVKGVISDFKSTVALAKLGTSDPIGLDDSSGSQDEIHIGDFVQWTSQGALRFAVPKRVAWLSNDGKWARVEGSATGIPTDELTRAEPSKPKGVPATSPAPSFLPPSEVLTLPVIDGSVVRNIDIPKMSQAAFDFFKTQLDVYKAAIVKTLD